MICMKLKKNPCLNRMFIIATRFIVEAVAFYSAFVFKSDPYDCWSARLRLYRGFHPRGFPLLIPPNRIQIIPALNFEIRCSFVECDHILIPTTLNTDKVISHLDNDYISKTLGTTYELDLLNITLMI